MESTMSVAPRHRSTFRRSVAVIAALVAASLALPPTAIASPAARHHQGTSAKKGVKAGLDGAPILIEDQAEFSGFDLATDQSTGTAYLAWISSPTAPVGLRKVHLCVLPAGATGCAGGILTSEPGDGASAAGVQVVVTAPGVARLFWFYDGAGFGMIAQSVYSGGGLTGPTDYVPAPDNGALLDAVLGPQGQVWLVTQDAATLGPQHVHVINGLAQVADVTAPSMVSKASLAFQGDQPVLAVDKYGAIGESVLVSSGPDLTALKPVAKTWSLGGLEDMVSSKGGVRLIASEDNAGYRPVVAGWKGGSFGKPELTGDRNACAPASHDLVTDPSGRAADVANECGVATIANLADTRHAGLARFSMGGTPSSGMPQITTTQRGFGWVAWGILSPLTGNRLFVAPVRLPALIVEKSGSRAGGKVRVQGPADCLPVVTAKAKAKAKPAKGWRLLSRALLLDGKAVGTSTKIHGESATSGERFHLSARAVFGKGRARSTATATMTFHAC
jgi:hypothetical protein